MTAINQLFPRFLPRSARPLLAVAITALVAGLAGCASPTPYGPRLEGRETGYTDRELTPTRYRITFAGNTVTPRETVETYLLLRAAGVTRAAGYESFVFDTRNTQAHTSYQAVPAFPADPWYGPWGRPYPYWGGFGFAYEPAVDVVVRTKYQAYAEIVLLTAEQAKSEPRAIRAADVISRIGPDAVPPPDRRPGRQEPAPPA